MQRVPEDIVQAARHLGRWINRAAYDAAKKEVEKDSKDTPKERESKIRQQKAKILVALDSMAMGARDATSMMGSIMRETGMLTEYDAPPEAVAFIDAACAGIQIEMDTARQLLMTYMRVRYTSEPFKGPKDKPDYQKSSTEQNPEENSDEDNFEVQQ